MGIEHTPPGEQPAHENYQPSSLNENEVAGRPFTDPLGNPTETVLPISADSALQHQLPEAGTQAASTEQPQTPEPAAIPVQPRFFTLDAFTLDASELSSDSTTAAAEAFDREYDRAIARFPQFTDTEVTIVDGQQQERWRITLQYQAANGLVVLEPAAGELNVQHISHGTAVKARRYYASPEGIRCDSRDQAQLLRNVSPVGYVPAEVRWQQTAEALQAAEPDRAFERKLGLNDQLVGVDEMAYVLGMLREAEPKIVGINELLTTASNRAFSNYAPHPHTRRMTLDTFLAGVHHVAYTENPAYNYRDPFEVQGFVADELLEGAVVYRIAKEHTAQQGIIPVVQVHLAEATSLDMLAAHGIGNQAIWQATDPRISIGIRMTVQDRRVVYTLDRQIQDNGVVLKKWSGDHDVIEADYDVARLMRNFLRAPRVFG